VDGEVEHVCGLRLELFCHELELLGQQNLLAVPEKPLDGNRCLEFSFERLLDPEEGSDFFGPQI